MGVERQLPPKREVALALLQGSTVSVYLDPRGEDVYVPPWFKKQPQLMLQIGLNMPVPIPDLDVGEDALSCTLSFNRRPEFCRIPWASVYALVGQDGRGMIWPDDVPAEVAAQAEGRPASPKASSHLRAVPNEEAPAEDDKKAQPNAGSKATGSKKKAATGTSAAAAKRKKKSAARSADKKAEAERAQAKEIERSDEAPRATARAEAGARKGKRELPSYLRVVK